LIPLFVVKKHFNNHYTPLLHFFSVALILFFLFTRSGYSQTNTVLDSSAIYSMSLEELMNIKSSGVSSELEALINSLLEVASKKPLSSRKSPSIVTLITQEEIEKSGARDLIDVLRLVPGIDFGSDVAGVVGLGMRGNWGHEGKILMLLDGQEMNEILYSSLQFGNHFDVSQIKRIEIIRGPGSAIYGGFAEYGVISIITKNGEDINGVSATATYGQMSKDFGRRNISVSVGKKIKDLDFSLAGFLGEGQRSDKTYTDLFGNSYSMAGNSALNPTNVNFGISYKKLSLRGIYDNYRTTTRDNYGPVLSKAYPGDFRSTYLELKYDGKINDKITITPKFNYKRQIPWNFTGKVDPNDIAYNFYDKRAERYRGNVTMSYDVTKKINIIAGAEVFYDIATMQQDTLFFNNGKRTVDYTNSALFVQSLFRSRIVNFTVGARFDNSSAYGSAFVPRVGITKKINNWNFKLLYNKSFRAPGIENIETNYTGGIKPENTDVLEFETGYQLTSNMFITVNVFDITTHNPIVYYVSPVDTNVNTPDGYKNMDRLGSRGAELSYKIKDTWGNIDLNYSFYSVAGKNIVTDYSVSANHNMSLAFPSHKFNISGYYNINKSFSISPSVSWLGERYGYANLRPNIYYLKSFSPSLLANLFINYSNPHGLKLGLGCYNIFDEDCPFIQPYNGGHPPLPGLSRELVLRLTYSFVSQKQK
jgi:outer membrane cobalamin receptor